MSSHDSSGDAKTVSYDNSSIFGGKRRLDHDAYYVEGGGGSMFGNVRGDSSSYYSFLSPKEGPSHGIHPTTMTTTTSIISIEAGRPTYSQDAIVQPQQPQVEPTRRKYRGVRQRPWGKMGRRNPGPIQGCPCLARYIRHS